MQKQESEENTTGPFELRTDANVGYVPLLSVRYECDVHALTWF